MINNFDDFAIVTYTHTACEDIWPMYFGQLDKHAAKLKSYAFSNKLTNEFENHTFLLYNNDSEYHEQYLSCLKNVKEKFVMYSQEDLILYDDVDYEKFLYLLNFLEEHNDISFVRLIRCGDESDIRIDDPIEDEIYNIDLERSFQSFQMQPTIFKKDKLIEMYEEVSSKERFEDVHWKAGMLNLGMKGCFVYRGEPRRLGRDIPAGHWDSSTYPYICTALQRGKWNMQHYSDELNKLFDVYNINMFKRPIRWTQQDK